MIDRALGQPAKLIDDILDGGIVVTLFQEQALGRSQDLFHRDFGVLVPRHGQPPS